MFLGYWTDFTKNGADAPIHITICGCVKQVERQLPQGYPYHLLFLTLRGIGRFETTKESVTLTPGDILLLKPHRQGYYRPMAKDWKVAYIAFCGTEADALLSAYESGVYAAKDPERVAAMIKDIASLPKRNRQSQAQKILQEILLSINEILPSEPLPLEKKEHESALYRAVFYICEHFREKITLADLARITGLHKDTVNSLFRRRFGITPIAYIKRTRYLVAEELLKSSPELSIAEIAKQCGFNSLSYFSRNFPGAVTPREFRKKYKNIDYFVKKPG